MSPRQAAYHLDVSDERLVHLDDIATARGRVQLCRLEGPFPLRYYLWLHPDARPGDPWLCAVHGISRDAREQARLLQPAAARHGYSIVAPLFDELRYPKYQRLGLGGRLRADHALCALIGELEARFGAPGRIDLFGFSGGAQFAHRFALTEPARVRRLAVAAAGWYTLPDESRTFPYGVGASRRLPTPAFRLAEFAEIPELVLVGADDRRRDPALRKRRHLDRDQGRTRVARARHWYLTVRGLSSHHGFSPDMHRFVVMPDVGHDFADAVVTGRLDTALFEFLTIEDFS